MSSPTQPGRRILVIDDNPAIHQDFRKILAAPEGLEELEEMESVLFGSVPARSVGMTFELDSAMGGEEGVRRVKAAAAEGRPYAMAFVDIRMPPGIDGVETTLRLWREDADVQVVLCSAYSDYSWEAMVQEFGESLLLRELRKPFNGQDVRQLLLSLA